MKDSLIGINEGIEKLTLTLLIGIKADLLQFILYPDRLLKLSNSLITLETETSKWSKYRIYHQRIMNTMIMVMNLNRYFRFPDGLC